MFGPTLLVIMLAVVETFMAFIGIILHSMSSGKKDSPQRTRKTQSKGAEIFSFICGSL